IRPHISVGYRILEIVHVKRDDSGQDWYRATKWQPYEISSVSVPADTTIGMGRSEDEDEEATTFNIELRGIEMPDPKKPAVADNGTQERGNEPQNKKPAATPVDTNKIRQQETERCQEIMAMGRQFGMDEQAESAVKDGTSVDKFRQLVLNAVRENQVKPSGTDMSLGLSDKEVRQYSLINAVRARITGNWKG
ncbi:phage major capsid protein, partial [Vibrio parahaemolyticus]|nr:hypothetical protein [Vibrio parahaemolyticus]NMS47711.1 phage major capsid protein [Vibrio parahaemolyticus]